MNSDEKYMFRCIEIARQSLGNVQPNPLVGCVVVNDKKIIGEGFHQKFGEAHAEKNAIDSVKNKSLLKNSTLYVNLEPCAHHGKTPPCAELIIQHEIKKIVIGCNDSNPLVSGKGIEFLKQNGCEVKVGILENESRELNKRFFTYYEKNRPYVILKWAQTVDGFIGKKNLKSQISNLKSQILSHKWRSEEQAIMVGTNTALIDNPRLNVRLWKGKNPLRIVIDKSLSLRRNLNFFDHSQPTIIFTSLKKKPEKNLEYITIDFEKKIVPQMLDELFNRKIQSLIVEGGTQLLNSFFSEGIWDEARIFISKKTFCNGVKAPEISGKFFSKEKIGNDDLVIFFNKTI